MADAVAMVAVGGIALTAIGSLTVALRREQRQNEEEIAHVRQVVTRVSLDDSKVGADQEARDRRRTPKPEELETLGGPRPLNEAATPTAPDQRLLDALAERAHARFEIQSAHYANALRQSTTYFYWSLIVGIIGFALLVIGVALAITEHLAVGVVTGVGGILTDAAAALVFRQANPAKSDAQTNLSAIAGAAERDENNLMAYIYASRIQDTSVRDATNAALARQLIAGTAGERVVTPNDSPDRPVIAPSKTAKAASEAFPPAV
jgi:hypothetical protein